MIYLVDSIIRPLNNQGQLYLTGTEINRMIFRIFLEGQSIKNVKVKLKELTGVRCGVFSAGMGVVFIV